VLQFALSDLAAAPWERALAQWIAWHDQNLIGVGVVGFDLKEIKWEQADFPSQKAFLLHAIDVAAARYRWDELCYDPPIAETYLRDYREIVDRFDLPIDSGPSENWAWPLPGDEETICPVHVVHCSDYGRCRVCVDCGADTTDV
jgi:hypothetical protein